MDLRVILRWIVHPVREFRNYVYYFHPHWMSDEKYLSILFKEKMGYDIDWENPSTFQEKIQWMKVHYHNPIYPKLVDKYLVKSWVESKIGKQYIIPTIGHWKSFDEINFNTLPDQFVLKCNHDSGSVVICLDKAQLDKQYAQDRLNRAVNTNYYWWGREWAYKNVEPLIIAEPLLKDNNESKGRSNDIAIKDYKFFCFDGVPRFMYISDDHGVDPHTDFFDMEFHKICMQFRDKNSREDVEKPLKFDEMKRLASALSEGFPFVRVDFYLVGGQIYFGEMTFYHASGFFPITPKEMNKKLCDMLVLPQPM